MGLFDWFKRKKKKTEENSAVISENTENITDVKAEDASESVAKDTCADVYVEIAENPPDETADDNTAECEASVCDGDCDTGSEADGETADDEALPISEVAHDISVCNDADAADTEEVADDSEDCAFDSAIDDADAAEEEIALSEDEAPCDIETDGVDGGDDNSTEAIADLVSEPEEKAVTPDIPKGYSGRFEINRTKDGKKFFFNLYASNKVGIATSQMYSTAQNALNGVRSVIVNAPKALIEDQTLKTYETLPYPKWEIYIDNGGKYRFRLNATNGSCVCHSQGYTSKANCKNGIDSIIRSSRHPEIDKAYLLKKD